MILPRPQDVKHKNQMFRLLKEILRDNVLVNQLCFKGGTYAALRDVLDRFSIDLDFDLPDNSDKSEIREKLYAIFDKIKLEVKDESKDHLQFFLKYEAQPYERNTLKLEINDDVSPQNTYEKVHLPEINMYCTAHTIDTMFANKLVAAKARFDKNEKIAGRDFYDLHVFFSQGLPVNVAVVEERSGRTYEQYLSDLISLIESELNTKILNQDLNTLLRPEQLNVVVDVLKDELLVFIKDELKRSKR